MLEHVWKRTSASGKLQKIVVATDDSRIAKACESFGAEVVMTSPEHASGTDRVAEVALALDRSFAVVVNVQGDEPFVSAKSLDLLVDAFDGDRPPDMATLAEPLERPDDLFDPNVVKVVTALDGRALYFSRSPIPFHRGEAATLAADFRNALASRARGMAGYRKHQGIYAYRRDALFTLTRLRPSSLEIDEGLEQLRALQAGLRIQVLDSDFRSLSVDTPADLARAEATITEAAG